MAYSGAQRHRWFVIRTEGGAYEFMPYLEWRVTLKSVPIFGVRAGDKLLIYDRILARMGCKPLRTSKWHPMSEQEYEAALAQGRETARYVPKWPDGYRWISE